MPEASVPRPRPTSAADAASAARRLGGRLGAVVTGVTAVGWGDRGSTWRVDLADGRAIAAQHLDGPAGHRRAARIATIIDRLAAAGLAVPRPAEVVVSSGRAWVMTPWIAGPTAAELLESHEAVSLARAMGTLSRSLSTVQVDDLDLAGPWDEPAALREAATAWLAGVAPDLDAATIRSIRVAVKRATPSAAVISPAGGDARVAPRGNPPRAFRHGDFAPINILVAARHRLVLVDFEHARRSDLPIDVAWWAWVVRHHHPAAWTRLGPAFLAAAGFADPDPDRDDLTALARLLLLERAAAAEGRPEARQRWLEPLRATMGWDGGRS